MPKMECLPLYAALSPQQQMRIWDSPKLGKRRVILSTNIGKVHFIRYKLYPNSYLTCLISDNKLSLRQNS